MTRKFLDDLPGTFSDAMNDIYKERTRQRRKEGWTLAHDDAHTDGSLAAAAAAYAYQASTMVTPKDDDDDCTDGKRGFVSIVRIIWPREWSWEWWKPKDVRRNLVRAGALILAEIERIDRREARRASKQKP